MGNESGYEGEEWGNTTKEDNSALSEMFSAGKECFINFIAIVVSVFLAAFLVVYYNKEILSFFSIEKIILFGGAFIFMICAFWGSHNKDHLRVIEFKEPKFPKE